MALGKKSKPQVERLIHPEDLVPDHRLVDTADDRFEHEGIARAVAEIAISATTPVNIALYGPWGSGKSSLYSMLTSHLTNLSGDKVAVVRYDAWKYGGKALKRNFVETVSRTLNVDSDADLARLHQPTESTKLKFGSWLASNWLSLVAGVVIAICVAALSMTILAWGSTVAAQVPFKDALKASLASAGTVLGLALVAILVGPKALEAAATKIATTPPSDDDQFALRFNELVSRICAKKRKRLVVFIDELDRCSPADVVSTLVDLKTFLDQPQCVFIVAADREVIERSLHEVPQAKPVRTGEPYYATPGAFLDKIFQHQIALPPLRPRALTRFAYSLVQGQGGVWAELRDSDSSLLEAVVFALIPVHVRSPRRVKVLLNNFATSARIAQARGIPWLDRAKELAAFTVLETEFPSVAADLVQVPRLLDLIRDENKQPPQDVDELVGRYRVSMAVRGPQRPPATDDDDDDETSAAGELLSDGGDTNPARDTLNKQLKMYLEKIQAGGIPDPRPDLFYLQGAGRSEAEIEPRLGDLIDFASDTAPDVIVEAFEGQPPSVLRAAVPLIVSVGEDNLGPGRFLALESASRLIERMDIAEIEELSNEIAPAILAASANPAFSYEAIPGAVLIALLADAPQDINALVRTAAAHDDDGALLERITNALPYARNTDTEAIYAVLREGYQWRAGPLHRALASLPLASARTLWGRVQMDVSRTLSELEVGTPTVEEEVSTQRSLRVRSAPESGPPPQATTGEGCDRAVQLLKAAFDREDGELLISEIYMTLQDSDVEEIRAEATRQAGAVFDRMSSAKVINHHVLKGLLQAEAQDWSFWQRMIAAADSEPAEGLATLVSEFICSRLMPALRIETDTSVLDEMPALVSSLGCLAGPEEIDAIETQFAEFLPSMSWLIEDDETASAAGFTDENRFHQRRTAHAVARALSSISGSSAVEVALANDIALGVKTVVLNDVWQPRFLDFTSELAPDAAELLSAELDEWSSSTDEELQRCQLRLRARSRFGGSALAPEELPALGEDAISNDVLDFWIGLRPPIGHVGQMIEKVATRRVALTQYASQLSVAERSSLWVCAEKIGCPDPLLQSIARAGIGSQAIDHMRAQLADKPRQQDRDRLVQRLCSSTLGSALPEVEQARKSSSQFVSELLDRESVGDAKLAAKLMIWSGGAGHGYVVSLRQKFEVAATQRSSAFNKSALERLATFGLLTPRKKGPLSWLLGQ